MMYNCRCCGKPHFKFFPYNNHLRRSAQLSDADQSLFNVPHNQKIFSCDFPIQVCLNCGYGTYTKDVSELELNAYYNYEYSNWNLSFITKSDSFDERSLGQTKFVEGNVPFSSFKSMLEIGAGAALPSIRLKTRHKNLMLHVVEPQLAFVDYYKDRDIVKVDDRFPLGTPQNDMFDYVHASHWLEHVIDLEDVIAELKLVLRPDGYLFLEVPNCDDTYYRFDVKDTPHLHFFTLKGITLLFERFNFSLVRAGSYWLNFEEYYLQTIGELSIERKEKALIDSADCVENPGGAWLRLLFRNQ